VSKAAVFLDRDGVINQPLIGPDGMPGSPRTLEQFQLIDGVAGEVGRLKAAGFLVFVVTNQPDIERQKMRPEALEAMHHQLAEFGFQEILVCPHGGTERLKARPNNQVTEKFWSDCDCRKPKPGLLLQAGQKYQCSLTDSYMVGDRWNDFEAGRRAGTKTVFIDWGYSEAWKGGEPSAKVTSLRAAVDWILEDSERKVARPA
jgi:D-glycero-D-manno-heptose 1,7-bisphosphate phosphatase